MATLTCPVCYIVFHRADSHAARNAVNCCSVACGNEARKVRVICNCVSCDKEMSLIPSEIGKITTCSKECSTLRRFNPDAEKHTFAAYTKRVKELTKSSVCSCGSTVRLTVIGLKSSVDSKGKVSLDESLIKIKCAQCHLESIAKLGVPARKLKHGW